MSARPQPSTGIPSQLEGLAARVAGRVPPGVGRPPPNLAPGEMIGGSYRIERELGRGGFGVVVSAMHLALEQRVAIKVLTEADGSTEVEWAEDAERFRREATATASLQSEHVVRVLDADMLEGGYPYIVMEYLDGRTLHDLTYATNTRLEPDELADYGIQILAALADAHAHGIVHRDLKPANVLIASRTGGPPIAKVLDFGVSKVLAAASLQLTRTGAMVGTISYMAPEQMRDARHVDGRADLWSVGVVLYEALARQHPFDAHTAGPKAVIAILKNPVPPLMMFRNDVPPGLDDVLGRLLEKSPERRFSTAIEAALALAPFASIHSRTALEAIVATPPPSGAAAPGASALVRQTRVAGSMPSVLSRPLVMTAVALVALVVLALVAALAIRFV